jgi:hypothetical protein
MPDKSEKGPYGIEPRANCSHERLAAVVCHEVAVNIHVHAVRATSPAAVPLEVN